MLYLVTKAVVSAIIIVIVSETARRNPGTGAMIASLPLISVQRVFQMQTIISLVSARV